VRRSLVLILFIPFLIVLSCMGCGQETTKTPDETGQSIVDDLGRTVRVPKNPGRIASLASSTTETLYDLGCGDRIVGVDGCSNYPPDASKKPDLGSGSSINLEMLVELSPDFVTAWWYNQDSINMIEARDIPVVAIDPKGVDDVMRIIKMLGELTGEEARARGIVQEMQEQVDEITGRLDGLPEGNAPVVYYELNTPMKTTGPGTFTDGLIKLAGGVNIAAHEPVRYPILSSEFIVEKNPDVIVIVSYGASIEELKSRAGWDRINAVKNNRVHKIDTHLVTCNPRVVKGLRKFAKWFHPQLFKEY
jgi:iron complex transport system substrate-binding protein